MLLRYLTAFHDVGRSSASIRKPAHPIDCRRFRDLAGKFFACTLALSALLLVLSCGAPSDEDVPPTSLDEIRERGNIRVITSYGPLSYFLYRGEPLGFEYELAQRFGDRLDVDVTMVPATGINEMFDMLESGEGDLVAYRLSITSERRERVEFSDPVTATRQVLVQPKPENWRQTPVHVTDQALIRQPDELAGREIHVRSSSAYVNRLRNLAEEIGEEIHVIEAPPEVTTEELIRKVHEGEIPLTVADENIARITSSYYHNVDVETPISLAQRTAWAVHPGADELLEAVNSWLGEEQQKADFYVIYNRYFNRPRDFRARLSDKAFAPLGESISPWDELFQEAADTLTWDWRVLAALAFQESRFNPNARSWVGAVGLMQLMPRTAREFGAGTLTDPEESIHAATEFLRWLDETWARDIPDKRKRFPFILASYNAGRGHVQDARRLAEYYDGDPDSWDDVSEYLLRKSEPEYYNHEVVHHGFVRGSEPVAYVRNIRRLYEHYVQFTDTPENGAEVVPATAHDSS